MLSLVDNVVFRRSDTAGARVITLLFLVCHTGTYFLIRIRYYVLYCTDFGCG